VILRKLQEVGENLLIVYIIVTNGLLVIQKLEVELLVLYLIILIMN